MGMFSPEVESIINREQDLGLMKDLSITEEGKKVLSEIQKDEPIKQMGKVLSDIDELGKEDILYLLYQLYPEFTVNSRIKEQVDSYKLQSATIDLKKLEEGDEALIKTDKGNTITLKKKKNTIEIIGYSGQENIRERG
jgi:predicted transcriptional regulator with HTH domain